jgi:hypothetical protein
MDGREKKRGTGECSWKNRGMFRSSILVVAFTLMTVSLLPAQKKQYVPSCLLEDTEHGVAFFTPEGFLPNPEEALKKRARSCWYGATSTFQHWGFFTFHRPGHEQGMDPTYWTEILEIRWGKALAAPKKIPLPEGEALQLSFLLSEGGKEWALSSVLVPAGSGVFDLTFFAPPKNRTALARFALAAAQTLHVHTPPGRRSFALSSGVGLDLDSAWKPVQTPPAGAVFQAFRHDRRYSITLSLIEKSADPGAQLRNRIAPHADQESEIETIQVPAGTMVVAWDTDAAPSVHALLPLEGSTLAIDAALPRTRTRDSFLDLIRTLNVQTPRLLDQKVRKLVSTLRTRTRVSRPVLRQNLQELTAFTGHALAAQALLPLLQRGSEDVVIETALYAATLSPFGLTAEDLAAPLAQAVKKSQWPQAAALIHALGRTQDPAAVALLKPHLDSKEMGLAHAAVNAIGHLPFHDGSVVEAIVTLYARLGESSRASRGGTRGNARDEQRFKLLYYPILTALRRQSGLDFPYPDGIELARNWLKDKREKK